MLRLSLNRFPLDASVKDASGLPWGCVIQPFAPLDSCPHGSPDAPVAASTLERCDECYAYINSCCALERAAWRCALCDALNPYSKPGTRERYAAAASRAEIPELAGGAYEATVATEDVDCSPGGDLHSRPVVIALVDATGGTHFWAAVKAALTAAVDAAGPHALFGLATYAHRLGLYDIQGPGLAVRHLPLPGVGGVPVVAAADAVPLESFLSPVSVWRDQLLAAIAAMVPVPAGHVALASLHGPAPTVATGGDASHAAGDPTTTGRGFGPAADALLSFLESHGDGVWASVRVLCFLGGRPDWGVGSLPASRYDGGAAATAAVAPADTETPAGVDGARHGDPGHLLPATRHYQSLASRALAAGITLDLCILTPGEGTHVDCASLRSAAVGSGGVMLRYPGGSATAESAAACTLPLDVAVSLSRPRALRGDLRLRTSPEFRVARAYGRLYPDAAYDNLYRLPACAPGDAAAFDFDFAVVGAAFSGGPESGAALQLAFCYTMLLTVPGGDGGAGKLRIARRLRVATLQARSAKSPLLVYESVDAGVVISLLAHKIAAACLVEGVPEGRLLLRDWLVILVSRAHAAMAAGVGGGRGKKAAPAEAAATGPALPDASLSRHAPLVPLPRLVYGLLRSSLLAGGVAVSCPDARVTAHWAWGALPAAAAAKCAYPQLTAYAGPGGGVLARGLPLSKTALATTVAGAAPPSCFLLDGHDVVIAAHVPPAGGPGAWPPAADSPVRLALDAIDADGRVPSPRLAYLTLAPGAAGAAAAALFESHLIDDEPGGGYDAWLSAVATDARLFLIAQASGR